MREAPNLKAKKLGVIPFGEEVIFIEEIGNEIEIAGATGKWTKVNWSGKVGWVFGGFLTDKKIYNIDYEKKLIGRWIEEDEYYEQLLFFFTPDYCEVGMMGGEFFRSGPYEINYEKNILIINGNSIGQARITEGKDISEFDYKEYIQIIELTNTKLKIQFLAEGLYDDMIITFKKTE